MNDSTRNDDLPALAAAAASGELSRHDFLLQCCWGCVAVVLNSNLAFNRFIVEKIFFRGNSLSLFLLFDLYSLEAKFNPLRNDI